MTAAVFAGRFAGKVLVVTGPPRGSAAPSPCAPPPKGAASCWWTAPIS